MHRRWLIPFAAMVLLWSLVAQLNHSLAPHGVYLFAAGLLPVFAALRLSLRHGFTATLLAGLAAEATEPFRLPGTLLLLLAAVHILLYHLRYRFPRDQTIFCVAAALIANLAVFLGVSTVELAGHPAPGAAWLRLFADLAWSQLLVLVVAPWFFALQERALVLARVDLFAESHR